MGNPLKAHGFMYCAMIAVLRLSERHTDTFFQSQPTRQIALRVALDLDVYNTLSADNGSPKSAAQLAAPKGADPVLVGES